jgi:hypothetical protein
MDIEMGAVIFWGISWIPYFVEDCLTVCGVVTCVCKTAGKGRVLKRCGLECNNWHTSVTPLFKTLDFVATVHLCGKLLVTQLIENFPKFMDRGSWLRCTRHPTKHWFLLETHMTPIHIFTTYSFQILFNTIFLSICLFYVFEWSFLFAVFDSGFI